MLIGRRAQVLAVSVILAGAGTLASESPPSQEAAAVAWEKAVVAKGGRATLYGVRSLLITATARAGLLRRHVHSATELLVPPGKLWRWADVEPTKIFGQATETIDLEHNRSQISYGAASTSTSYATTVDNIRTIRELVVSTLLEAPTVRPTLHGVNTRHRQVVIDSTYGDQTFVFYLDEHSSLPERIIVTQQDAGKSSEARYELKDYRAVAGIHLPHEVTRTDLGFTYTESVAYQVNVDYDESVFDRPPEITFGPDGWRRIRQAVSK